MSDKHISVMLNECIEGLNIKPDGIYVDLTLGRGGHSLEILKRLSSKGKLIAFDKDISAINYAQEQLKDYSNLTLIHTDFSNLKSKLAELEIDQVDGILMDLGVSSPQLDNAARGFSYSKDSSLDMRMDQSQGLDATQVVNEYDKKSLVRIFDDYGDVKLAPRVAQGIVNARPIKTTLELVDVIRKSLPAAVVRKKNPAKAVFQAIRIEVNNELDSLKTALSDAIKLLNKEGRLCVITFHSLEDRIVKKFYFPFIEDKTGKMPIIVEKTYSAKTKKPSKDELEVNNRSRSAKLRILIKGKNDAKKYNNHS